MDENISASTPPPSEEVSKEEIALATSIVQVMVKSAKGIRMYQANSPLLGRFFEELTEKMSSMLSLYNEYKLDVDQFELKYKGCSVYENSDTSESMAFRMYSDGIRSIIFSEGIDELELREFLDIVNMSSSGSLDDDMVTRLWDKGLPHFTYLLEDDFQEIDRQIDNQLTGLATKVTLPPACLADPFSCATQLQALPQQLYSMSAADMTDLQALLAVDENLRSREEMARILSSILSGVQEPELFTAFLDIYLKVTRNLFLSGETEFSLKMFTFLYRRTTAKEPSAEKRQQVLAALGKFWTHETGKGLCKIIDTTDVISTDELKNLSIMIGQTAPSALCELLGMVEKMKMRKVLIETTTEIARENPQILGTYLSDSRWYLVRNVMFILTQIKDSTLLDQVIVLITHRDQRVRKEVLKYLIAVPEPRAKPYLLKFLRDESSALRIMALQLIGRTRLLVALKPISDFVETVDFEKMGLSEKKAVYEALGELGGRKMLPRFQGMLTKKFLFQKNKEKEAVLCAVAGLQKISGEETLKLLEDALHSKGHEFREVIKNAITVVSHRKDAPASRQEES